MNCNLILPKEKEIKKKIKKSTTWKNDVDMLADSESEGEEIAIVEHTDNFKKGEEIVEDIVENASNELINIDDVNEEEVRDQEIIEDINDQVPEEEIINDVTDEDDNHDDSDSDIEDEVELLNERPQRIRSKPKILTYDRIGGNPTFSYR